MQDVLDYLDEQKNAAIDRLRQWLSIPSISTDPAYVGEMSRAADWVQQCLVSSGLDAEVLPTGGHPVVLGYSQEDASLPDAPTVLFYGHYDVQPPDPVDLWTHAPFAPTIRDGAIYARGACDDKGQVSSFLEAVRAWSRSGQKLPCRIKILIEGEEESGSVHLPQFIEQYRQQLSADVVLISDTNMWVGRGGIPIPAITYALRGILYFDVKLHGPNRDLHSGMYGGTLANPATHLVQVLGGLFDNDHRLVIPGFYDDVMELNTEETAQWHDLGFDEPAYLSAVGVDKPFGEYGYDTLQRRWARPSCDINGLYGGYGGEGAKTIIPSFAAAKVSFRLAANQSAMKVAEAFEAWIGSQKVHGCRWELTFLGAADPVLVPIDSPWIAAAGRAIQSASGVQPAMVREGASIPVVSTFKTLLGLDTLLVGYGLDSDQIHAPDEHFGLDRFHLGCRSHAHLLYELGRIVPR